MLNTAATHMLRTLSGNLHVVYVCLCVLRATASTAVVYYLVHQRLGPLLRTPALWFIILCALVHYFVHQRVVSAWSLYARGTTVAVNVNGNPGVTLSPGDPLTLGQKVLRHFSSNCPVRCNSYAVSKQTVHKFNALGWCIWYNS